MHMTDILNAQLLEATRLTNAGRLTEATAVLQRVLGRGRATPGAAPFVTPPAARRAPPTLEGMAEPDELTPDKDAPRPGTTPGSGGSVFFGEAAEAAMPDALRSLLARGGSGKFRMPGGLPAGLSPGAPQVPVPPGAQFLAARFGNEAGTRPYKLYVPSGYRPGRPVPLVVMLHGCTQSPDDFAVGTRMNDAAETHTCLVAYPGQTGSANMQKCWNWFSEGDQHRGRGEPSLIAGITLEVMRDYAVDSQRVYVAGLSAGGAAAAIMGDAYPDLFAAIGVHSGLACGAARDVQSAFAAMQGSGTVTVRSGRAQRVVPAIVFHGDRDSTVNPRNADAVVAQSGRAATLTKHVEQGRAPGGHTYTRTLSVDPSGRTVVEQWVVHGAKHAWFGGSAAGSYTDPHGPDATSEMLRFFLEHPHPASGPRPG